MRIIEYYVNGLRYEYYSIDFDENSIKLKLCVLWKFWLRYHLIFYEENQLQNYVVSTREKLEKNSKTRGLVI